MDTINSLLKHSIWFLIYSFVVLSSSNAAEPSPSTLGDRLVLSINNVPYSQLQIEGYLNVKEALRGDIEKSQVVAAENWAAALAAFMLDMTLYQEATKSSGFRPQKDGIQKSLTRIESSSSKSNSFNLKFKDLGLDESAIKEHLSRILTVENLKRSRQGLDKNKSANQDWEQELQKHSIVRWFDGGKNYESIRPTNTSHKL